MKFKISNIIYILILATFLSCQNDKNIEGNYSICQNGDYMEVYFRNDSMRVAKDDDWVGLSKWRKIKIKNDILHFETFGEWRDSSKAEIKYLEMNKIQLRIFMPDETINLEPISDNPKFENLKDFWNGYYNRQNLLNCKKEK